jgi:protein-disulfide isomerase
MVGNTMNRRQIMMAGAALAAYGSVSGGLLAPNPALAAEEIFEDDRILGDANAPVTIIEYASLTCPHCAAFHGGTLQQLKETWIKEGRARLVYRDYPLDRVALTGSMIAHCFEQDQAFFAFLEMLYAEQRQWALAESPVEELAKRAKLGGIDRDRFNACLQDEDKLNRILEKAKHGQDSYKVSSTPSLVIGGELYSGNRSFEELERILEEAESRS